MDHLKRKRVAKDPSDESSSSDGSSGFSYKNYRPKKKSAPRRQDAGRRYQRGLMYDSQLGITCHFCRQKTTQKHVLCRTCVLAYCGPCLRNRHGEDIEIEAPDADDDSWLCPKCRGGCGPGCKMCCNCTFCRKKQGLKPPKISFGEMRAQGFDNVHDYLIHLETGESPESISARKSGKGWCRTHEKRPPSKDCQSSHVHERREQETRKGLNEVASSAVNNSPPPVPKESSSLQFSSRAGLNEHLEAKCAASSASNMRQRGNDAESERPISSFPSQFSARNDFKEKLEAKLAEPFNTQELKDLWEAVKCRKPLWKNSETPHGSFSLPTKEPGYSYIDHHPDLAKAFTAAGEQEVKLKLMRGFFFWLEHASMSGSFKPWIENDKDEECFELDGSDCKFLGVVLNVDDDNRTSNRMCHGENLADMEPKIKREFVEDLSSHAKPIFNWDEVDIKPKLQEGLVNILSFNPQIQVKEELDAS